MKQHSLPLTAPVRVLSSEEVECLAAEHRAKHGGYLSRTPRERWLAWARDAWRLGHREAFRFFMRRARNAK